MPDVLLAPGSVKSLKDCKIGAGGVKDVVEIDIGVNGQVYKVWPSVVPYEDGTDLLKVGGILYTAGVNDSTGTAGSSSTSWGRGVSTNNDVWDSIFWYAYPDVNVAQIDYLYCNYFYSEGGRSDSTYRTGGTFYCSVGDNAAGNPRRDSHMVSYYATISAKSGEYFRWGIDMRNISSGILKIGFYATYAVHETHSSGEHSGYTGNAHLKHLYAQLEEPTRSSSGTFALSTMT